MNEGTPVLVTGGAGFIGSHLALRLAAVGHRVRVLDNLSTGRREHLDGAARQIEFLEGDLRDAERVAKAVVGVETVFHQAALPSVPRSIEDPITTHEVNATGTLNLLEAARRAGVRRVVYAASSSAYGETPTLPKVESMPPVPKSPYATSKLAGELYARTYAEVYGLPTVSLRYFNVFGPRQDPESPYAAVIPRFLTRMLAGRRPVIYGDGDQTRDFTYIDNVVEANLLALAAGDLSGQVLNIACGERTTLNALVAALNELLGTRLEPEYQPARPGDIRHSYADISCARRVLGFAPSVDLFEGLRRTLESFRRHA